MSAHITHNISARQGGRESQLWGKKEGYPNPRHLHIVDIVTDPFLRCKKGTLMSSILGNVFMSGRSRPYPTCINRLKNRTLLMSSWTTGSENSR